MSIEEILDNIEEMLDKAWNLPLTGGRCVVDVEKLRDLIDDIRLNMPAEIKQARHIVADRTDIINAAKSEAEMIIRKAEERAQFLISDEEIVRQSQLRASELISQAQSKSRELRAASQDFADSVLKAAEESLAKALIEIKNTRSEIHTKPKK